MDSLSLEQSIQRVKSYFENIIRGLPCYVYWKDKNFVYLGCNDLTAQLLHLPSRHTIVGKTDYDFGWEKKIVDSYRKIDEKVISEGESFLNIEEKVIIDGRALYLLVNKEPLFDEDNEIIGLLGISVDITERKNMEEELRRSKIAAEAANQAKSEFIANMSHDIRTPLTGVIGMAKVLEDSVDDEDNKQIARFLEESGNQLLTMLNDILDIASSEHINDIVVQEEVFDLRKAIKNVVELERPSALLKKLSLISEVDQTIPLYLVGDSTKIHRIILNLLGNAIKFTKKGSIILSLKCLEKNETDILIQVCVIDTGIGIPLEFQDKVFDKFTRGTPSYKGLYKGHGLGLHMVQSYVQALGGRIKFTSEEDKGTTFFVDLTLKIGKPTKELLNMEEEVRSPSWPEMTPTTSKSVKPIAKEILSKEVPTDAPHILLVEDNRIALITVENIVKKAGCRFTSAIDGERALVLAKVQSFDLIITDLGLPGISGIEFVEQLRAFEQEQQKKPVPIVGLTAHAQEKVLDECVQAGINEVESKPMTAEVLERIKTTYLSSIKKEKLGVDLSDTEDELFDLSSFPLFDVEKGLEGMAGNLELLKSVLTSVVHEEIPADKLALEKAHAEGNWEQIEKLAHRMKGGFVYCGTIRLIFAAQYLERYHKAEQNQALESLYRQFISVIDKTILVINEWLVKN